MSLARLRKTWSKREEMSGRISLIVTTYERPDALDAVLRSLARQTDRGFEAVVADDGSGPATAALVAAWQPRLGVGLKHVWHEHRDFRAGEIRNRAILASGGDYLHLPRRRLHPAAGLHRHPPAAGRTRLLRHRQPRAAVARADRGDPARPHGAGNLGARDLARRAPARRRQPAAAGAAPAARAAAQAAHRGVGGRALLQPRGLARRPRPHRRLRRGVQRLGARRLRPDRAAPPRRRPPQGRDVRDRRAAPLAPRKRPHAAPRQPPPPRRGDRQRPHPRRTRDVEPRRLRWRAPLPLAGRGWGWGSWRGRLCASWRHPPPSPPPQGGREQAERDRGRPP